MYRSQLKSVGREVLIGQMEVLILPLTGVNITQVHLELTNCMYWTN